MLDNLILLRLLAAASPDEGETLSKIAADMRPLAADEHASASQWQQTFTAAVEQVMKDGSVTATGRQGKRLRLTEAGRKHVREVFAVPDALPHSGGSGLRKNARGWAWHRDHFALPKALNVAAADSADALRGALLRQFFLPDLQLHGAGPNLRAVIDQVLAHALKTHRANVLDFRVAALRAWLHETATPTPSAALYVAPPEDLPRLARMTFDAARRCQSGRFGDHKVFIHSVWRQLQADGAALPGVAPGDIAAFKTALVQANNQGLLNLSRADLVGVHDPADIAEAETRYLHEAFHFIRLD